jgi:hypothetical protein
MGGIVYYQRNGRSFARAIPERRATPPTPRQVEQQYRFILACAYARGASADPRLRDFYTRKAAGKSTAYAVAMRDFMRPPEITLLDVSRYHGRVGDRILIDAHDDTAIVSLVIEIRDLTGRFLETGPAQNEGDWIYEAMTRPTDGHPLTILAQARDQAGNTTRLSAPWIPPGYLAIAQKTERSEP